MSIYFIQAKPSGRIKIGFATNPRSRLRDIQCGNPEKLKLVGWLYGDRTKEHSLHWRFAEYKIKGEWFSPEPSLLDFIAIKTKSPKILPGGKQGRGFLLFLSESLRSGVKEAAAENRVSMSRLIRQGIRKYLKELRTEAAKLR